jgi:hypothetical protein
VEKWAGRGEKVDWLGMEKWAGRGKR